MGRGSDYLRADRLSRKGPYPGAASGRYGAVTTASTLVSPYSTDTVRPGRVGVVTVSKVPFEVGGGEEGIAVAGGRDDAVGEGEAEGAGEVGVTVHGQRCSCARDEGERQARG